MADAFVVTSGKGGVGKTTTAINLAVALREDGHPTAVLDADLGMPNVGEFLGVDPEVTLHEILSGRGSVEDAIVEVGTGLSVVSGDPDLGSFANADPDGLERVVGELTERYRYVVVDTGGGLSYEGIYPLELADGVILVTSPLPAAVTDTKKSKQLADRLGVPVRGVVVTHATDGTDPESIAERLGVELLGSVPADPNVTESAIAHQSLLEYAPDSPSAAAYRKVAATVAADKEAIEEPTEGGSETASDRESEIEHPEGVYGEDADDETIEAGSTAEQPPEPEVVDADPTESGRTGGESAEAESAGDSSEAAVPNAGAETETETVEASEPAETEVAEADNSIDGDDSAAIEESAEEGEGKIEEGEQDGEESDHPVVEGGEEPIEDSDDGESADKSKPGFFSRLFGFN